MRTAAVNSRRHITHVRPIRHRRIESSGQHLMARPTSPAPIGPRKSLMITATCGPQHRRSRGGLRHEHRVGARCAVTCHRSRCQHTEPMPLLRKVMAAAALPRGHVSRRCQSRLAGMRPPGFQFPVVFGHAGEVVSGDRRSLRRTSSPRRGTSAQVICRTVYRRA